MLEKWAVRGVEQRLRGRGQGPGRLSEGRPIDRNAVEQSRAAIDSLYKHDGYYSAQIKTLELPQDNGKVRVVFDVDEGQRVAISQVVVEGQPALPRQAGGQAHGHPARGLLVVPEGRVRRAQGGPGRPRAAAALVRRQRLRRLPGDARLAGRRLARAARRCCTSRSRRASRTRSAPSTSRATAASRPRSCRPTIRSARSGPTGTPAGRAAAVQPLRLGRGHGEGPEPLRQQRLHLRPGRADRDPPHRRRRQAGRRPQAGPSARARRPRSTRSRSSATTSPTSG